MNNKLDNCSPQGSPGIQERFLWFFILSYSMVIVLANWFDPRIVNIFGFNTDAGTLIFPLTFVLSSLITEVYGYKYARRAIWSGFLFNSIFILYGLLVIHLPSPNYATNNAMFDTILSSNIRVIIGSAISYLSSEPLNSMVMAKLKIKMKGKNIGIRFLLSTLLASMVDSFIFGTVAFYGSMGNMDLLYLILTMCAIKSCVEIISVPMSVRLVKKLKAIENADIYDNRTNFNLFNLDVKYTIKDNAVFSDN